VADDRVVAITGGALLVVALAYNCRAGSIVKTATSTSSARTSAAACSTAPGACCCSEQERAAVLAAARCRDRRLARARAATDRLAAIVAPTFCSTARTSRGAGEWGWGPRYFVWAVRAARRARRFWTIPLAAARTRRVVGAVVACGIASSCSAARLYWDHFIRVGDRRQESADAQPQHLTVRVIS